MVEICVPSGFKELLERMMHAILWNRPLRLNRFILAFLEAELDKRTLCELTINASTYNPPLSPQKVASSKQLIDAIVSSASSEGFSEGFELKQRISISNAVYGKQQIVQRVGIWATAGARVTRDVGTETEKPPEKPVQVKKGKNAASQTERSKKSTKSAKTQSPQPTGTLVQKSTCREVGTTTEGLQIVTNRSAVSVKKEEIINGVNYKTSSAIQSSITIAPIRSAHSAKRDEATETASMKVSGFKAGASRDAGTEIDYNIVGTTSDSTLSNQKSGMAGTLISTTLRTQEMKSVSSQTGGSVTRMGPKVKSVLSGSGHVLTDLLPMATSDVMISTEDPPTALYVDSAIMTDLPNEVVSVTESRSTVQLQEGTTASIKQITTETVRMTTGDSSDHGREIVKQVSTETVIQATKVPSGDTAIVAKATQDAATETGAMSPEGVELVSVMIDIRARATPDFLRRKDDDPFIKSGLEAKRNVIETEHGATIALQVGVTTPAEMPRDGSSPARAKPFSEASSKAATYESKAKSGITEGAIDIAKESAESVKDISGATENEAGTELPRDSATGSVVNAAGGKVVRTKSKTDLPVRDVSTETDHMFNMDNRQQISASSEPTVKTKTITELNLTEIQMKRQTGSISEHESLQTSSKSSSKTERLPKVTPPNFYEDEEPTLFKSRIDPACTTCLDERDSSVFSIKADEVTGELSSKCEGEEPNTTSTSQARIEDILKVDNSKEIFAMVHDKTAVVDTDKSITDKEASESRRASEFQPSTEAVVDAEMSKSNSLTAAKEASQPETEQPIDASEHQQSIEAIKDATGDNADVESITAAKEASQPGSEHLIDPSEHQQSIEAIKDATADNADVESITAAKEESQPGSEHLIDASEHQQSVEAIKDETADNSNVESLNAAKEASEPPLSTEAVVDGDKSPGDVSKSNSVSAAKEASDSRRPSEHQPSTEAVVDATADSSIAAKEASEPGAPSEPRLSVAEDADADTTSGSEKSEPLSAAKDTPAALPPLVPGEPIESSGESASESSNTANAAKDLASPRTIIEPQVSTQDGVDADSKSEKPIKNDEDLIDLDSVPREIQSKTVTVVDKRTQSQLNTETSQVEGLSEGGTSTPTGNEGKETSSDVGYESQEPAGSAAREVKPIEITSEVESTGSEADSEAPIKDDNARYMTPTPVLPLEGIENAMAPPESTTEISSEPTDSDIV